MAAIERAVGPSALKLEVIKKEASGPKKPVSILFIPGFYHAAWAFKDTLLPYFASHGYSAYAMSVRGHGASEGREHVKRASFEQYLSDVREVIHSLKEPLVLLGHSLGGMLIQKYLESKTPAGCVLVATPTSEDMKSAQMGALKAYPWSVLKLIFTGNPDFLYHNKKDCRSLLFNNDTSSETDGVLDQISQQPESHRMIKDMLAFKAGAPLRPCPTLVIGAEEDMSIPRKSLEEQAQRYQAKLKIYPGKPHEILVVPGWQSVAEDIRRWLDSNFVRQDFSKDMDQAATS